MIDLHTSIVEEIEPVFQALSNDDLFRMARGAGFVWCNVVEAQFWQALTRFALMGGHPTPNESK